MKVLGQLNVTVSKLNGQKKPIFLIVVDRKGASLLGENWLKYFFFWIGTILPGWLKEVIFCISRKKYSKMSWEQYAIISPCILRRVHILNSLYIEVCP